MAARKVNPGGVEADTKAAPPRDHAAERKISPAGDAEAPLLDIEAVERRVRTLETEPDRATLHELAKRDPNSLHQATVYYALVSTTGGPFLKYKLLLASYAIVALQALVAIGILWGTSYRTCNVNSDCIRGMWCRPNAGASRSCVRCYGADDRACCWSNATRVGECGLDPDFVSGMCSSCTSDEGKFMPYTKALRRNVSAMMIHDWAALLLASLVVAFGVFGEIRDATLCRFALRRICEEKEVPLGWRWALHTLNYLRLFAFVPCVVGCVMALVLSETGNSIAICLNAGAVLFLVEVDNLAFSHGLDEDLRREAEEFGRILLTDTEARILDAIKRVCALGVPGVILGGVGESNPWIIVGVCAPLPCMVVALVQSALEAKDRRRGLAWGFARGLFGWLVYYLVFFLLQVLTSVVNHEMDEQTRSKSDRDKQQ